MDVDGVKKLLQKHFENMYTETNFIRPTLDDIPLSRL